MADPVLRVQSRLTDRDHVLLGWLYDHGTLTTPQIAHALFGSLDFAQRRLLKLTRLGVLDRFQPAKVDGGSYPYHYVLGRLGVEVVAAQRGDLAPRTGEARQRRRRVTAKGNLAHRLGASQFFIELAAHARTHPGAELIRWWPEAACRRTGAFREHGDLVTLGTLSPGIRPDGHGIWTESGQTVAFWLEFDTGSEPLSRLIDKLDSYERFAEASGLVWPVLFWLHSSAREHHLHQRLAEIGPRVPVATASRDHMTEAGLSPAEQVWYVHGVARGLRRLAELADHSSGLGPGWAA